MVLLLELFIVSFLGIFIGIITGLAPGIHINLISVLLFSFSPFLLGYTGALHLAIFIVSIAVTHTFLDALPSIFLGAPEEATALAVLPGHRMLLEGHGYEAVFLIVLGSLVALLLAVTVVPLVSVLIPIIYETTKLFIPYLLILVSVFLIWREKTSRFWAFFIFLL